MTKTNIWMSVIAAVLAIGTLVGVFGMLSKVSGGGAGNTEKEGAILNNDSDKVEYFCELYDGSIGVKCTDDSLLKANKKYRLICYFNEADQQAFLKKYEAYGLRFFYALCAGKGLTTNELATFQMNGVVSGSSYDFLTSAAPGFSFVMLQLLQVSGRQNESVKKEIFAYMKEHLRFGVYELPDDTVIQESIYTPVGCGEPEFVWQYPTAMGQYSYVRLDLGPVMTHQDYRILFQFDQSDLNEAAKKLGMDFRYGYTFNLVTGDADGGVPIASFNSKGVCGRACFDFQIGDSDVVGFYILRSSVTNDDPAIDDLDRDAVLAFLKGNIHYSLWKIG